MAINLSNISQYFQYPDKVAELKNRLYLILKNKGIEVTANESLNSLIEKVREVEPALEPQTIYLTQNNTSYDVTEYTEAIVDVPPVTVENDLDGLIDGSLTSFTMPSTISSFATERFNNFSQLSTVIAPEVTYIPSNTFQRCISLESINLPNVVTVGNQAFKDCVCLSEINLEKVYHIGSSAFKNCVALSSLNLPNLRNLYAEIFDNCATLSQVSLTNLRTIENSSAFRNTAITELSLPNTHYINNLWLDSCKKLTQFYAPNLIYGSTSFPDGLLNTTLSFSILSSLVCPNISTKGWIDNWPNLESISWPLITHIAFNNWGYLLQNCNKVSTIILPELSYWQYGKICKNLLELTYINIDNLWSFYDTYGNSSNYFIDNCTSLSKIDCSLMPLLPSYFMRSTNISEISLARVSIFYPYALNELSNLKKIDAPELKSIQDRALRNCSSLSDYTFSNLYYVGTYAFENCTALSVPLSFCFPVIKDYAFYNCHNLSEIYLNTLSIAVTGMTGLAFENCGILENASGRILVPSAMLSNYISAYSSYAFSNKFRAFDSSYEASRVFAYEFYNSTLTSIPDSKSAVKIIHDYGFANCSKLVGDITFENVEYIGDSAFMSLRSTGNAIKFSLPNCKMIGYAAFFNPRAAIDMSLPEIEYIGSSAFYHNENNYTYYTKSFYFPKLKFLGDYALCGGNYYSYYNRLYLQSPNLSQLEYLGAGNFRSASVYISESLLSLPKISIINPNTFYSTGGSHFSIYGPNIERIGAAAFAYCQIITAISTSKLNTIESDAFLSCTTLSSIDLYDCKTIGARAFASNTALSMSVNAPNLVSIGYEAFSNTRITQFNAPELLSAGQSCFANCTSLQNVYMPKIDKVYTCQFYNCYSLSSITMDFDAVSEIGISAFTGCSLLSELSFINVKSVNTQAFMNCSRLTSLTLNSQYSIIEPYTFAGCTNLNFDNLSLENKISIGSYAFRDCYQLTSFVNKYLTSTPSGIFHNCTNLSIIEIPNVLELNESAFCNCSSLISLDIKYSLIYNIPSYTFTNCKLLNNIYFSNLNKIGQSCFSGCTALSQFDLINVTEIPTDAFNYCVNLTSINLSKISTIGSNAFYHCEALSYIELDSIQSINNNAFNGCSLLNISIPNLSIVETNTYRLTALTEIDNSSITIIKASAFENCTNLSNISLTNVSKIDDYAFRNCSNLTSIYIPNISMLSNYTFANTAISVLPAEIDTNLSQIPQYCFYKCSNISTVLLSQVSQISTYAFGSCTGIQTVSLQNIEYLSQLGQNAFINCSNLTEVNLPNITNLRSFILNIAYYNWPLQEQTGFSIFYGASISILNAPKCSQFGNYIFMGLSPTLESINLPACTSLWDSFANFTKLKTVNLEQLYSLSTNFFYNNYNLENVNVSRAIYVGNGAFTGCSKLTQLNIPSANILYHNAFSNCTSLSNIKLGLVETIGEHAFYKCSNLESLNYEVIDCVYGYAFRYCSKLTNLIATNASYSTFEGCNSLSKLVLLTNSKNAIYNFANTFRDTPMMSSDILGYFGSIYVPYSVLSFYKANYASYSDRFEEIEPSLLSNYVLAYNHYGSTISLSDINISAKYILNHAFEGTILSDCTDLVFSKVKYIGTSAFYSCSTLSSLEANNCEYLGTYALANCTNLRSVSLPKVYNLGTDVFYNCPNLKVVSLPNLVGSFTGTNGMEELYLDKVTSVTVNGVATLKVLSAPNAIYWSCANNANISYLNLAKLSYVRMSSTSNYGANLLNTQLSNTIGYFNIGASLIDIKYQILQGRSYGSFIMSGLSTIPDSMLTNTTISYAEFLNATTILTNTFKNATIGSISLPKVSTVYTSAFANASLASNLILPEVTYLYSYALQSVHGCSEIIVPKLISCGQYAFQNASVSTLKFNAKFSIGTTRYMLGNTSVTNIVFNNDVAYLRCGYQMATNPNLTRVIFNGDILDYGTWYGANTLFINTPISQSSYLGYYGSIYVPSSLLSKYQTRFSEYYSRITTIEDHEVELRELGLID